MNKALRVLAAAAALMPMGISSPLAARQESTTAAPVSIPRVEAIDRVWAGHPVKFAIAQVGRFVVVGYYDANRQLTIASSPLGSGSWRYFKLDSWLNWDSHNTIAIAGDSAGRIHVVANLHNDPLAYWTSDTDSDLRTLHRAAVMATPELERHMTYPQFITDAQGKLVFKYRDGSSGKGNEIYNVLDATSGKWRRLLDTPFADGEGQRNAYFVGPVAGPDGWFHLVWVWRDNGNAETNHDLSYARSRDLVRWEQSDGTPQALPIKLGRAEVVDPVPVEGGMINGGTQPGFGPDGKLIIAYHKFDAAGNTQIYLARREGKRWASTRITNWQGFRWDFRGTGSLDFRLRVMPPQPLGKDRIRIVVERDGQPIELVVDARTLKLVSEGKAITIADRLPPSIKSPEGMRLQTLVLDSAHTGKTYALVWATRAQNRDRATPDIPEPSTLHFVTLDDPK